MICPKFKIWAGLAISCLAFSFSPRSVVCALKLPFGSLADAEDEQPSPSTLSFKLREVDFSTLMEQTALEAEDSALPSVHSNMYAFATILGERLLKKVWSILCFKPPLGFVALAFGGYLIVTGRLFHFLRDDESREADDSRRRVMKRIVQLDPEDSEFLRIGGGVGRRRRMLCLAALQDDVHPHADDENASFNILHRTAIDALQISLQRHRSSRMDLLKELTKPLAKMEALLTTPSHSIKKPINNLSKRIDADDCTPMAQEEVVQVAFLSLQALAVDLLLRSARDQLAKTAYRLYKDELKWDRRVRSLQRNGLLTQFFGSEASGDQRGSLEAAIHQLMYTKAAAGAERQRLGRITELILRNKVSDVNEEILLSALKASSDIKRKQDRPSVVAVLKAARKGIKPLRTTLRTNRESETGFHLYWVVANMALKTSIEKSQAWQASTEEWMSSSRTALCSTISEVLSSSSAELRVPSRLQRQPLTLGEQHFGPVAAVWGQCEFVDNPEMQSLQWSTMIQYVDSLSSFRRFGAVPSLFAVLKNWWWFSQKSLVGLPSYVLAVLASNSIHNRLAPRWGVIWGQITVAQETLKSIIKTRIWMPLKGIVDDLMNKNEGMMSGFSLKDEEATLDVMLNDIGCGDGSPDARAKALHDATLQYEEAFNSGSMVWNFASGKLVRLLLVQLQQVKVGMLSALDTIDLLFKGNRIHLQILAAIPAFFAFTYGTKVFFGALYNIRARDLRPLTTVHAEMASFIDDMELTLLRASSTRIEGQMNSVVDEPRLLSSEQMGQFVMLAHRYLVLLDYGRLAFSPRTCDQIRHMLQQLLVWLAKPEFGKGNASGSWEFRAISMIRSKHYRLLKSV